MQKPSAGKPDRFEVPFDEVVAPRAVISGVAKPRRENADAGDLPASRIRTLRILLRLFPASLPAIAFTLFIADFLRTGKCTSPFWLVSQGIVVFLFILRKDAVSIFHRP